MIKYNKPVKFRVVILDDYDNVIEVLNESPEYSGKWDKAWLDYEHNLILDLNEKYDFYHYDDCPLLETQIFVDGKWKHHSDPIDDWFNL